MSARKLSAASVVAVVVLAGIATSGVCSGGCAGLAAAANEPTGQSPYDGPHALPGAVEAEDFDTGGEGVAFHETSDTEWDEYRRTSVNIGYSLNAYWVDRIERGEWLEYTVEAAETGTYDLTLRFSAESRASIDVTVDGETRIENATVPATNRSWRTVTVGNLSLGEGTHVVRITANDDDWRFDRFGLTDIDGGDGDNGTVTTTTVTTTESETETATTTTETETGTETETETQTATTTTATETETQTSATTTATETEATTTTTTTTTETETATTTTDGSPGEKYPPPPKGRAPRYPGSQPPTVGERPYPDSGSETTTTSDGGNGVGSDTGSSSGPRSGTDGPGYRDGREGSSDSGYRDGSRDRGTERRDRGTERRDRRTNRTRADRGTDSPARTTAAGRSADAAGRELADTDGDGVIDSEDYAPRDVSVQRRSDVSGDGDGGIGGGSKLLVLLTAAVAPLAYRQFG